MVQWMPGGILHQGTLERMDFPQNLCISNKQTNKKYNVSMEGTEYSATMWFIWLSYFFDIGFREIAWIHSIFLQSVDKIHWKSEKLIIFCSPIIWILFISLFTSFLYSSLEFFKRLGSCKVTYIGKSRITTEDSLLSSKYSIRKRKSTDKFNAIYNYHIFAFIKAAIKIAFYLLNYCNIFYKYILACLLIFTHSARK